MSTTSPLLKLTLQALGENPDTWGDVLNNSAIQLLENAIAATASVDITIGNVALAETAGGAAATHYRRMIVNVTGSPGIGTRTVSVPPLSKIYLVANSTGDASTFTFKTTAGTGVVIPAAKAQWVYCNGTNIIAAAAAVATTAETATTATNALQLVSIAGAEYAQKNVQQTYTKSQSAARVTLAAVASVVTPNYASSNSFYVLWSGNWQLAAPTNPVDGGSFSLFIRQNSGGPHTITFAINTFVWANGIAPTLSTGSGDVDMFGFEYFTNHPLGARWVGAVIKDVS